MSRITRKQIAKAIKEKTGWDVQVWIDYGDGCCHFYSETDEDLMSRLAMESKAHSTTVYVCALNHLSIDQWVESFQSIIKENKTS